MLVVSFARDRSKVVMLGQALVRLPLRTRTRTLHGMNPM